MADWAPRGPWENPLNLTPSLRPGPKGPVCMTQASILL